MAVNAWQLKLVETVEGIPDAEKRGVATVLLNAIFGWRFVDAEVLVTDGLDLSNPLPAAGRTCIISIEGDVLTHWVNPETKAWTIVDLGKKERFFDYEMRKIADAAKLSDDERGLFFEELRKWVQHDYRLKAENNDLA